MPILFIFILPYVLPIQLLGCHNIINVCLLSLKYKHSIVISLKANRVLVLVFWTYYVVHYTAQQNNHVTVTAVQIHEPFHLPLHSAASFLPCEHMRARAVLGVVILSVCLPHAWIMAKLNDSLLIFWYHVKGQSLCYSDTNSGWWATPLRSEICVQIDSPPSKNADFDRFPLITSQP